MNITERTETKYVVIVNGKRLTAPGTYHMAERYFETLTEDARSHASIIPVTEDGKQVLMG